jgi:hypothetical protein
MKFRDFSYHSACQLVKHIHYIYKFCVEIYKLDIYPHYNKPPRRHRHFKHE